MINCFTFFKQEEPLSRVANIELPQKSARLSKNELAAISKRRFKTSLAMSQYTRTFDIGGVLLGFEDYTTDLKDFKGLEDKKEEWVNMMKGTGGTPNIDRAEIIKVNNTRFLIQSIKSGDEYFTSFISDKKGRKGISGSLQYKLADKEKADKILNEFLKKISFKAPSLSGDN